MAAWLGLASGLIYGAADFIGGVATRRAPLLTVVLLSQLAGSVLLLAILPLFPVGPATTSAWVWGASAGLAGAAAISVFYRALALHRMSIVAPTSAVVGAAVPVIFGLAIGERPSALALIGVVVAVVSIALVGSFEDGQMVAGEPTPRPSGAGLWQGSVAGLGFGVFFILLAQASSAPGLWPILAARATSLTLFGLAAVVTRPLLVPPRASTGPIAAAGGLDVLSNILYLLAIRSGLISLVAVMTSLYPASTVVLARLVLKERLSTIQVAGLAGALFGVALMASN